MRTIRKDMSIVVVCFALLCVLSGCGDSAKVSSSAGVAPPPDVILPEVSPTPAPAEGQATNYFYFSYDDSASTAAVELVKYQLNHNMLPSQSLARPWEFLNYESFDPANPVKLGAFSVSMGVMSRTSSTAGITEHHLGVYVQSPEITLAERPNVALTLVVDVSGSMNDLTSRVEETISTRLDVVKYGLNQLAASLKEGDVVNLVKFSTNAQIVLQNVPYSRLTASFIPAVDALRPEGSTNLNDGITKGYAAAMATLDQAKLNRVVLITDAYANTGEVDSTVIAQRTRINELEGIYFSGIGVGSDINEAFLDELTEEGRGAYFSVITRNDARRAFQERFIALVSVAARHVRFRLDYPAAFTRASSAAEESSTVEQEVRPTNFSYNTSQYFYEVFSGATGTGLDQGFTLTVTYTDPATNEPRTETIARTMTELAGLQENNIRDAETIFLFTELLGRRTSRDRIDEILKTHYAGYSSPLFTEYTGLMDKYRDLADTPITK